MHAENRCGYKYNSCIQSWLYKHSLKKFEFTLKGFCFTIYPQNIGQEEKQHCRITLSNSSTGLNVDEFI